MWKKIDKVFEKLISLSDVFGAYMLLIILLSCLLQAGARQFRWSILWTEELSRYCFVLLVFVGSIYATRHAQHITTTMLLDMLPMTMRRYASALLQIGIAVISGALFYSALMLFRNTSDVMRASALSWLKMRDFYLAIGIACLGNGIAALFRAAELILNKEILQKEQEAMQTRTKAEEKQMIDEYQKMEEENRKEGGEAQ